MSVLKSSAILSAEAGRALPVFDLLGRSRRAGEMAKTLNQLGPALAQRIALGVSGLFNGHGCRLEFAEFTPDGPPRIAEQADSDILSCWIVARAVGRNWAPAIFWFDAAAAYRLAVLFFGGTLLASDLKHPSRPLTDAEQRLMLRLFQRHLDGFCEQLGWPGQEWALELVPVEALPRHGEWFSAQINMALADQSTVWQLWWPFWRLEAEPEPAVDETLGPAMQEALPAVPLRLRLVLAQTQMKLEQLTQLKAGDVVPVDWAETALALLGQQPFLRGRVAEHNKGLVFQVTEIVAE